MFVFGHIGATCAAVSALDPKADLRPAAFLAVLPDLLDKTAYLVRPSLVAHNTRGLAHTLAACALVALVLAWARRRRGDAAPLSACYAGHMLLDLSWTSNNPAILLWPLLGPLPAPVPHPPWLPLYNVCGEMLGLALLLALLRRRRLAQASSARTSAA